LRFQIFAVLLLCISTSWAFAIPGIAEGKATRPQANTLTGKALADYVNQNQQLFKAESNGNDNSHKYKLMDLKFARRPPFVEEEYFADDSNDTDVPESFDARDQWPYCPSLKSIRDQANCGSCWAVSSAEAMSDRVCIASEGSKKVLLSADDLLTCCSECGYGCDGGWPIMAWHYFVEKGICTGGAYGEKDVCKPYEISPCGHHKNETYYGECDEDAKTPKCVRKCQDGYPRTYKDDKIFGKSAYSLPNSVSAIQRDIMKNGPVVAAFTVYSDFMQYRSGIYKHTAGGEVGGHAVKIIGWGTEKDVPYWIIANSWNSDWGEDGFFRMIRGENDCEIEENIVAGLV
ncbi:papain family cysteine protease, partial [Ancylostoma caninum]